MHKPEWIRVKVPSGETWQEVSAILERRALHTVCDEARCPNKGECWGAGTATFMILGDTCTRGCRFCAVSTSKTGKPVLPEEAEQLSLAVEELMLKYAVLTSVDRDDLEDRGSHHFARCIQAIKDRTPMVRVEALIPDFVEGEIEAVIDAQPDVVAHNIETVRSIQYIRDKRASYDKSLHTLYLAKKLGTPITKSSILLGLGEQVDDVLSAMDDLRAVGVDVLVLGQYLQPGPQQLPVAEYIHPNQFKEYDRIGRQKGFKTVVSSPFARTSYHAQDAWAAGGCGGCGGKPERGGDAMTISGLGKPAGCKLIRFTAELENQRIKWIQIRGDFFAVPEEAFEELERDLQGTELLCLADRFTELVRELHLDIEGISGPALAEVFMDALLTRQA